MGLLGNKDKSAEKVFNASNKDEAVEALQEFRDNILKEARESYEIYELERKTVKNRNVLSNKANEYYKELGDRLKAKQLTKPGDIPMPESEVEKVLDNMNTQSSILNGINVVSNTYLTKVITNGKAVQKGTWGDLTETVVTEMLGAFKVVEDRKSVV